MDEFKYLAIKNWHKYQGGRMKDEGVGRPWVKDYVDKEADREYLGLTPLQRYTLDGCRRLRGRFGRNLPNDGTWIARALQVGGQHATNVAQAVTLLTTKGFLLLTNQEHDLREGEVDGEGDREERESARKHHRKSVAANSATTSPDGSKPDQNRPSDDPPAPTVAQPSEPDRRVLEALTPHQLARGMMDDLGIPGGQNDLAVWSRAIELKSRTAGIPLLSAYQFIREKAHEAQNRGEFTRPIFWMKDAAYDHKPARSKTDVATDEFRKRGERELQILRASNGKSA
jgi:hypothetical protein